MKNSKSVFEQLKNEESGQAIVIIAAALIVLIGFTGLAIDLGFVWFRQAQLKSIVDSAALAGAPELGPSSADGGIGEANQNAIQYLATNQRADTGDSVPLEELTSFDSSTGVSPLGAREFTITATWDIPLFFMPVFGFDTWSLTESSTAAYFPLVDLYAGRRVSLSGITTSTQSLFGPNQGTSFGDAFSPTNSRFREERGHDGTFTYRIEVPVDYTGTVIDNVSGLPVDTSIVRVELLDPDSINRFVPAGSNLSHSNKFVAELQKSGATVPIVPVTENNCGGGRANNLAQPCVIPTCEWDEQAGEDRCRQAPYAAYTAGFTNPYEIDQVNPFWFYRMDELRRPGGSSTDIQHQTVTLYTLYYYAKNVAGIIERVDLASYAGQSELDSNMLAWGGNPIGTYHAETDLKWVSPGAWNEIGPVPTRCQDQNWPKNNGGFDVAGGGIDGCTVTAVGDEDALASDFGNLASMGRGFEINMGTDVDGIVIDEVNRTKYIYLDIKTVAGASENGFEIWAGPPHSHYGFKSDVNSRNLQMTNSGNRYSTDGVSVYSLGIMPLNSLTNNRVDFPLVYVPPEFAGSEIEISLFDTDSGTDYPLCFYFDTLPKPECVEGFDDGINGYMTFYNEANDHMTDGQVVGERCFPRCQDSFVEPAFVVKVPQHNNDCDTAAPFEERMHNCNVFLGGRLMVSYNGGGADTYQWLVSFPSVPYIKE